MSSSIKSGASSRPNDLEAHFMPFTSQRSFQRKPRLLTRAKGMYYYSDDGRKILDAFMHGYTYSGHRTSLIFVL